MFFHILWLVVLVGNCCYYYRCFWFAYLLSKYHPVSAARSNLIMSGCLEDETLCELAGEHRLFRIDSRSVIVDSMRLAQQLPLTRHHKKLLAHFWRFAEKDHKKKFLNQSTKTLIPSSFFLPKLSEEPHPCNSVSCFTREFSISFCLCLRNSLFFFSFETSTSHFQLSNWCLRIGSFPNEWNFSSTHHVVSDTRPSVQLSLPSGTHWEIPIEVLGNLQRQSSIHTVEILSILWWATRTVAVSTDVLWHVGANWSAPFEASRFSCCSQAVPSPIRVTR